jgi:hypothetical protein
VTLSKSVSGGIGTEVSCLRHLVLDRLIEG